jgi:hypothetical protein
LVGIVMVNAFIHCGFQWMEWYIGRLLKNDTFLFGWQVTTDNQRIRRSIQYVSIIPPQITWRHIPCVDELSWFPSIVMLKWERERKRCESSWWHPLNGEIFGFCHWVEFDIFKVMVPEGHHFFRSRVTVWPSTCCFHRDSSRTQRDDVSNWRHAPRQIENVNQPASASLFYVITGRRVAPLPCI